MSDLSPEEMNRIQYRKWYLPRAIRTTRRKLDMLEQEARDIGRHDLIEQTGVNE